MLRHQRAVVAASAVLLAVMVTTSVLVWTAVDDVRNAFSRVERLRAAVLRLDDVEHAIAAETYAEAGYLRAPTKQSRTELVRALGGMPVVLGALKAAPDPVDREVGRRITTLNARYADGVRGMLAASGPARQQQEVSEGAALTSMQRLVDDAVARHREQAADARAAQKATLGRVALLVPVALLTAVLAVLACWSLILRQHKRLIVRARVHEWASTHDELTGVPNRTLMWDVLDAELDTSTRDLALLLVDLDRFKDVNDTHGHAVGDAVLVAAARRLEDCVGAGGVVARLGGDEFAVLVQPAARGQQVADDLRRAFEQEVHVSRGLSVRCTATVGCAVVTEHSDRLDLLRRADLDMYAGKPRRSNQAVNGSRLPSERQAEELRRSAR